VKDGVLTVSGEKRREHTEESEGVFRAERTYGAFSRKFSLPEEVDGDKIEAAYKDGVLTITLPKKPEVAPKRIAVSTLCTKCRADLFFSYRREGSGTGRLMAVIGIGETKTRRAPAKRPPRSKAAGKRRKRAIR